jgi:hypothetical protein
VYGKWYGVRRLHPGLSNIAGKEGGSWNIVLKGMARPGVGSLMVKVK